MILTVFGSRGLDDSAVYTGLERLHKRMPITEIIPGFCREVGAQAARFAVMNDMNVSTFTPEFMENGKPNVWQITDEIMKFIAARGNGMALFFIQGESKGTQHAIERAQKFNVSYEVVVLDESTQQAA